MSKNKQDNNTCVWKSDLKAPVTKVDKGKCGLYMHVNEYLNKNIYPFHMPGHKRNPEFFPKNLIEYDLTEIEGMDNLHYPNGAIKETEEKIAAIYGSERSHILVNGSTSGITASIMTHTGNGKKLLIARNSHKSAYSGLILSGALPRYAVPNIKNGVPVDIEPQAIRNAMEKDSEICCVLITSPTYEGMTSDIEGIAEVVHEREDAVLIVDEAHGAHFPFHKAFPVSAVNLGADIVIHSLHKTLPVLGQCSVLHVCGERADAEMLESALRVVQTSSPSYMFMSVIDKALTELYSNSKFDEFVKTLRHYRSELGKYKFLILQETSDISKLWFNVGGEGMTGLSALRLLREHGVELEMCGLRHVLAMTSIADKPYGFERLLSGAKKLDAEIERLSNRQFDRICDTSGRETGGYMITSGSDCVFSPREIFYMNKKKVDLVDSAGHVAAQFVTPYPPGIPILVPGELITVNHIEYIFECINMGIKPEGLDIPDTESLGKRLGVRIPVADY